MRSARRVKKSFVILILILIVLSLSYSNEKSNGDLNTKFHKLLTKQYASGMSEEQYLKVDKALGIAHPIFAGIAYAGFYALDGIGIALTYLSFTNPASPAYTPLRYAHIAVAIPSLVSFATLVTLGFTKIGLKKKYGYEVRKVHFVASFVTLGFYVLELASLITSAVFFVNDLPGKEWVGVAHGIVCGVSTLAFSVSLITIFL